MYIPEKTITSNPYVDNVLYYAKFYTLNCTVKDEEEALANETAETLRDGDTYIACIEGNSKYEMFVSIPEEILEKYIEPHSNLDLLTDSAADLKMYLKQRPLAERTEIYTDISHLARNVYIDHYDVMNGYLDAVGDAWLTDNLDLHNRCVNGSATYQELFDVMPLYTRTRIIKQYLNNYDSTQIDDICENLSDFQDYIASRTDVNINTELDNITKAMRAVFASHYEIMVERGYVKESWNTRQKYICFRNVFEKCKKNRATYLDLYPLFPEDDRLECLNTVLGADIVEQYALNYELDNLINYFDQVDLRSNLHGSELNAIMTERYMANYNTFLNFDIYMNCKDQVIDYYDLIEYIPWETRKMILNTKIEEYTNIQVYANSKPMLDSFLNTLPIEEKNRIKEAINKDMQDWYPSHHIEKNNYYRALIGLPPMDSKTGYVYEDNILRSFDENLTTNVANPDRRFFKNVGNDVLEDLLREVTYYPDIHWKQPFYQFDGYDLGILNNYGVIDTFISRIGADINSNRYRYLKYLGDNKLDLYTCRKAANFQLVGLPISDDDDAKKIFLDSFAVNRDYAIRCVYTDAYKFQSDYYVKFVIIFILINTIMTMLEKIPELIIDREVFDYRCIKYLFESFGIPYYSEIPIKYQRAMLKNLNILIKYKSSTKNMIDICKLFGFHDVRVFGYYLFKQRNVDPYTGEYVFDENNDITYDLTDLWVRDITGETQDYNGARYTKMLDYRHYDPDTWTKKVQVTDDNGNLIEKIIVNNDKDVYVRDEEYNDFIHLKDTDYFKKIKANMNPATLRFIKVPIDDELTDYKNDPNYLLTYDEIVYQDEGDTWDGGLIHEELYNRIRDYEFNAVKTKYISVETVTEMTELSFQVAYFYNMLFDNFYSEDNLTVKVPHLKKDHQFRFMDIVCYLFSLMYLYNDLQDNIMYSPTQILYVKGYNYNEALNAILQDDHCFTQYDEDGVELKDYQKDNIFDVNERIAEDGYEYREAFKIPPFGIRAFNLEADIDELEKWLNDNYQLSLSDFIVDDSLTDFNQIITLRQFFSLNNSYYQKDIFKDNIIPLQFNQIIKYGYGFDLYLKSEILDIDNNIHYIVTENGYNMEVIDNNEDPYVYILDYVTYIETFKNVYHALYRRYTRNSDNSLQLADHQYYIYDLDEDGEYWYNKLLSGNIYIRDKNNRYIFSADHFYRKNSDGTYSEYTDDRYFSQDPYEADKRILNFGEYYVYDEESGHYILDPDNCYIIATRDGVSYYILYKDISEYNNPVITEDDMYILHSDGHFIKLSETDYYRRRDDDSDEYDEYYYDEEDCFVIVEDEETEYYDPTVEPRIYYKKLTDFYSQNNWVFSREAFYVQDSDGNYIPESNLVNPDHCYFVLESGEYALAINYLYNFKEYQESKNINYILLLDSNYSYTRLCMSNDAEVWYENADENKWYLYNSNDNYVTIIYRDAIYADTESMIVVFNKETTQTDDNDLEESSRYNPEVTDRVWDENDWFYYEDPYDEAIDIGMHGENIWYYRKPGQETAPINETESGPVGSGFYMESTAYIGDIHLEEGCKYYMAFDVETNFDGPVQIYNEADSSVNGAADRVYYMKTMERQHISQIFIANGNETPEIRFLKYDFDEYPINYGDYIIVSNIKFIRAYSENFIANDIPSYDKLQELYRTNEAIYKYLIKLMVECSDKRTYDMYKKLYDSLMVSKYNKEAFKIGENEYAKTYTDFLQTRDAILYNKLVYFKSLDPDTMHKEIADDIIEITYAIDDCVDSYSYGYLYSYFPAVSANYIQQYISKIINFFKSWKVHLLGINTVYKFDDTSENTIKILEYPQYRNRYNYIGSNIYIYGSAKINPLDDLNPANIPYPDLYDLEDPTHSPIDTCIPKDRIRMISRTANRVGYSEHMDNLHIKFNDEEIKVRDDNNDLVISSAKHGFKVANINNLIMMTDEDEQESFASQIIDEINYSSYDNIDWRDIEEDE